MSDILARLLANSTCWKFPGIGRCRNCEFCRQHEAAVEIMRLRSLLEKNTKTDEARV